VPREVLLVVEVPLVLRQLEQELELERGLVEI
jgi:hypothetical protein